jgi:hypothetical protein
MLSMLSCLWIAISSLMNTGVLSTPSPGILIAYMYALMTFYQTDVLCIVV